MAEEFSVPDLLIIIKKGLVFIRSKIIRIIAVGILGALIGFIYAYITPLNYLSKVVFVVQENRSSGSSVSSLVGQFGLDISGGGGGDVFAGDNILLFLKSESLCRETMLSSYDDNNSVTLADKYAECYGFTKKWSKQKSIGYVSFSNLKDGIIPRLEDSLLQVIVNKHFLKFNFNVSKPDRKASFIQIAVTTRNEKLSYLISKRLVEIATQKYIDSKIRLKLVNVTILQKRADSLAALLNDKITKVSASQQNLIDVNPAIKAVAIPTEISTRDKSMIATIFAEVVKNLEIAKTILSQETPSIQIVDKSTFPLEKIQPSKVSYMLIWGFVFVFFYLFYIIALKWIKILFT
jgi:hypothetical protein